MKRTFLIVLLAVGCASSSPPPEPPPCAPAKAVRKLPAPAHIPEVARRLLSERMATHGQDMSDLVWAMLFVDNNSVAEIAENIASQPRLARPTTNDATELASRLPSSFFDLQDELVTSAERLSKEARAKNVANMGDAYGALTATCVRCHAAYLSEPPGRLGTGEMSNE